MIKKALRRVLNSFGLEIVKTKNYHLLPKKLVNYSYDLLYTLHNADFMTDPHFMESYNLGKLTDVNNSVSGHYEIYWRIHVLCWAASHAKKLDGDFVDCGVNNGIFSRAVINYIDFNKTGKTYFLLDTFSGLDERYSSEIEMDQQLNKMYKDQYGLYERVVETFSKFNTKIIKGAVPDTLAQVDSPKIAYLSVDMNCVQPEIDALEFFWDKMVPGGIIILDDYGYGNMTNAQRQAHDKFAKSKNVEILSMPTCQGIIIKP